MNKYVMARHDGGPTESTERRRVVAAGDAQGTAAATGSGLRPVCHLMPVIRLGAEHYASKD